MTRDTFRYREAFEGSRGVLPGETAPRLLLIHDFPAGPDGLTSPRAGAGLGLSEIQRFFHDGEVDYGVDFAEVYSRQVDGSSTPGAIDVYRVVASDAERASGTLNDQASTSPVEIGAFTAVGSGPAYNRPVTLEVVEVLASASNPHPAGASVPVFNVTVAAPNPDAAPEVFRRIVFTKEGGKGTSPYHRTIDAAGLTDRSMVVDFNYDPAADGADYSGFQLGDIITVNLTGGSLGAATLGDTDWEDAIDAVVGIPFRWRVIPNPPSSDVRALLHISNKSAPFGFSGTINMYGESVEDLLTARDSLGNEADDGKSSIVWGWGPHPTVQGREVPFAAGYFGRYSAKINAAGMGGEYPVGGLNLGYTGIAEAHRLTAAQEEALAQGNIMFAKQMASGSYGVHGSWTLDGQFDRMGDLGTRIMWNDIIRRIALIAEPLAHNRGATILTQERIKTLCDQAIMPYVNRGYLLTAQTGVSSIEDAANRFPGLGLPADLLGWVAYIAQLRFYRTLQGIYAHFTDADVAGLQDLLSGGGTAGE